jgi:hypothetical protein
MISTQETCPPKRIKPSLACGKRVGAAHSAGLVGYLWALAARLQPVTRDRSSMIAALRPAVQHLAALRAMTLA